MKGVKFLLGVKFYLVPAASGCRSDGVDGGQTLAATYTVVPVAGTIPVPHITGTSMATCLLAFRWTRDTQPEKKSKAEALTCGVYHM